MDIDTPCIGVCSTVYGDEVCRGCKRDYREVIEWNGYTSAQKQAIYQRLSQQISHVCQQYIQVEQADILAVKLKNYNIRFRHVDPPCCWAYALLNAMGDRLSVEQLPHYGIRLKADVHCESMVALSQQMDDEVYALAIGPVLLPAE